MANQKAKIAGMVDESDNTWRVHASVDLGGPRLSHVGGIEGRGGVAKMKAGILKAAETVFADFPKVHEIDVEMRVAPRPAHPSHTVPFLRPSDRKMGADRAILRRGKHASAQSLLHLHGASRPRFGAPGELPSSDLLAALPDVRARARLVLRDEKG